MPRAKRAIAGSKPTNEPAGTSHPCDAWKKLLSDPKYRRSASVHPVAIWYEPDHINRLAHEFITEVLPLAVELKIIKKTSIRLLSAMPAEDFGPRRGGKQRALGHLIGLSKLFVVAWDEQQRNPDGYLWRSLASDLGLGILWTTAYMEGLYNAQIAKTEPKNNKILQNTADRRAVIQDELLRLPARLSQKDAALAIADKLRPKVEPREVEDAIRILYPFSKKGLGPIGAWRHRKPQPD